MPSVSDSDIHLNLRLLANEAHSIAKLCAEMNMNRQQFNKYLAGDHIPSRRNLSKISKHFSIPEKDLYLEHGKFRLIYEGAWKQISETITELPRLQAGLAGFMQSSAGMKEFHGVYLRYQVSSIYPDVVLRCPLWIHPAGGVTCSFFVERFQSRTDARKTSFSLRYHGICNYANGKVFMIDSEVKQKNEIYLTVLTPIFRRKQMMIGTINGVSANALREPFSTRVVCEMIGRGAMKLSHFKLAASLKLDDPSIPEDIRSYLLQSEVGSDGGTQGKDLILRAALPAAYR